MSPLGFALTCLVGLVIGIALGGFGIAVFQQIRTGRIKLPPHIALGPVKLDLSSLAPATGVVTQGTDLGGVRPLLEGGGATTGSCLALIGSTMVLVGFILPWFTCNLANIISGSFSGLTVLFQSALTIGLYLIGVIASALLGVAGGKPESLALGVLVVPLALVLLFIILPPIMGIYIGRIGLRLIQTLKASNQQRKQAARRLTWAAVIGIFPMLCYFSGATANINLKGLANFGVPPIEVSTADVGLWTTLAGFVVAFIAGIVISTAVSISEQLPQPQENVISTNPQVNSTPDKPSAD